MCGIVGIFGSEKPSDELRKQIIEMGKKIRQNINAASNATFAGIYTHGGHSYDCSNKQEIQKIAKDERDSVSFNSFFFYNVFSVITA